MMRRVEVAGLILVSGIAVAIAAPTLDPAFGVVLSQAETAHVIKQCSRSSPKGVTGAWTPAPADIAQLERSFVPAYLAAIAKLYDSAKLAAGIPALGRQYGGILIGARKVIYVNGFPGKMIDFDGTDAVKVMYPDWHMRANAVCDGGSAFFGVEYDTHTATFAHFAFNGSA